MSDVAQMGRALLIAAILLLLDFPLRYGGTTAAFAAATLLMFAVNGALLAWFRLRQPLREPEPRLSSSSAFTAAIAIAIAAALVAYCARTWLHEILIYPHDAWRADMLVVIQEGIRRLLRGQNPYVMYKVPWETTLPYGPVMWLPYVAPFVMRVDVRFVSLAAALFVPVACALAAAAAVPRRHYGFAAGAIIILAAIAASSDLRNFASIAHTPTYWPGVALMVWFVARERWPAAALVCGLLIVARTTLIAVAPVLVMAAWIHDKPRFAWTCALLALGVVVPYLPFAFWNFSSLQYALYGSYQVMMKGFVWKSTPWVQNTVGVTGLLLRANLQSFVEPMQAVTMATVLVLAWRSMRRGAAALPWMAFSLFVFSATTLWPVHYVYFDVVMLWAAAALADSDWIAGNRIAPAWLATAAASVAVVLVVALVDIPRDPAIDVGIGASRPTLYKGFSTDEGHGSDRTFAWIDGTSAEVLVDRRSRRDADVELLLQPHLPTRQSTQDISVALNGIILGTQALAPGWQTVMFRAPAQAWRIGVNELTLSFSTAVSPQETGTGDDSRKLSAALDRLTVRTRS